MKLLQKILVPVDFSESSSRSVEIAIMLARKFNSQILLLHVFSNENISRDLELLLIRSINERLQQIKSRIIAENLQVSDVLVEEGVPFERIIHIAQTKDVNVIIAGSGSKSDKDKFKLGTTVEKLMRKNQVPLWVVKNEAVKPIRKIMCPVDFSNASRRALNNAITLADQFNAELTILNVFTPVSITSPRLKVDNNEENIRLKEAQQKEFDDFLKHFDLSKIQHKIELINGDPHAEILKTIQHREMDLLLMGTTGKTGLSRILMGSVTEKVTRELPSSFITTKARDLTDDYFESNLKTLETYIHSARDQVRKGNYERAIEIYFDGLKQYPDNIPILTGLVNAYEVMGNTQKADYYRGYAKEVVRRIWGEEYLDKFDMG